MSAGSLLTCPSSCLQVRLGCGLALSRYREAADAGKEHSLCDMTASAQPGSATNCSDAVGLEVGRSWHFSRPQLSRLFNGLGEMTSVISSSLKLCDQCQTQGGSHGTRRTGLRSLCCPGVGFRFFGITGLLCQDKTDGWKLPGLTLRPGGDTARILGPKGHRD